MSQELDVILKVFTTLDYLKLCVDHKEPKGDAVPVDIVVMPDLVIDIDGAAISKLNDTSSVDAHCLHAPAEIGSRAGRVLSILSYLRDLDDEGFQLHLISKTGHIGRAILEERLGRDLRERKLQPLRFPLLTPGKQTRYAVLGRESYTLGAARQITRHNADTLLTSVDLQSHFYKPITKILDARALYFATDSQEQFAQLVDLAVFGQNQKEAKKRPDSISPDSTVQGERHVFLDFSAIKNNGVGPSHETKLRKIAELLTEATMKPSVEPSELQSHGNVVSNTLLTLIMNHNPQSEIEEFFASMGLRKSIDTLVLYDENKKDANIYDGLHRYHHHFKSKIPEEREALMAGILLFRAVGAAWKCIPALNEREFMLAPVSDWTGGVLPDPYSPCEVEQWPLKEAICFGKALSNLWASRCNVRSDKVPDKRELLLKYSEDKLTKKDLSKVGNLVKEMENCTAKEWYQLANLMTWEILRRKDDKVSMVFDPFIKLLYDICYNSKLSWHPNEWSGNQTETLMIANKKVLQSQFALQTLRRLSYKLDLTAYFPHENHNKAYLTDLDGTLVHSSALRKLCLKRAFLALLMQSTPPLGTVSFPLVPKDAAYGIALERRDAALSITTSDWLDRCVKAYDRAIYKKWREWEMLFEEYPYYLYGDLLKDFRLVWNHPLSYPLFIFILAYFQSDAYANVDRTPSEVLVSAFASEESTYLMMDKIENELPKYIARLQSNLDRMHRDKKKKSMNRQDSDASHFFRQIATLEQKYKRDFEAAINTFWEVEFEPFRQTRELLRTMNRVLGAQLYVATEGHHDTQVNKINILKLSEFFPEAVIMSTGAATSTNEDLRIIDDAIGDCKKIVEILDSTENARTKDHAALLRRIGTNKLIKAKIKKFYEEINKKDRKGKDQSTHELYYIRSTYKHEWENFAKKDLGLIFYLILSSVFVDPVKPIIPLTSLRYLESNLDDELTSLRATRFIMFGDREVADIIPLLNRANTHLSPPVTDERHLACTVRIITADHWDEDLYWTNGKPMAKYVVWSPVQALLLLTNVNEWGRELHYNTLPPIVEGRLADRTGVIFDDKFDALSWGEAQNLSTYSLINYLIMQATIQESWENIIHFIDQLSEKMQKKRSRIRYHSHYMLAWDIIRLLTVYIARSNILVEDAAGKLRDLIFREIKIRNDDTEMIHSALGLVQPLRKHCGPPAHFNLSCIPNVQLNKSIKKLLQDWYEEWERKHECQA